MTYDVTIDRDKFIGGSDVSAIMGLSHFKTRWQLLMEKSGYEPSIFTGNEYTDYGTIMEPKIREHLNAALNREFKPDQKIQGYVRANTDGYDGYAILEIKTTSQIHDSLDGYKGYLVQTLFYMDIFKSPLGYLAVYERPEDFNEEFDSSRLKIHEIHMTDYIELLDRIKSACSDFWDDLLYVKEHPLCEESDLPSESALIVRAEQVMTIGRKIAALKELEKQYGEFKAGIYEEMFNRGMKKLTLPDGTMFTVVLPTEPKAKQVFDEKAFVKDHKDLYEQYMITKMTSGRSGYLKVTESKECGN